MTSSIGDFKLFDGRYCSTWMSLTHTPFDLFATGIQVHAAYAVQGSIPNGGKDGVSSSLWTGPVVTSTEASFGSDMISVSLANWSAVGLALQDVHAKNIDGSDNSCIGCCAEVPPFEIQSSPDSNWTRVAHDDIVLNAAGSEIQIKVSGSPQAPVALRYAGDDFAQCVVVNSDGLAMAPFSVPIKSKEVIVAPAPHVTRTAPDPRIQSPPLGFNSWNFFHGNIDENSVKAVMDAFVSNGMKDVGYE